MRGVAAAKSLHAVCSNCLFLVSWAGSLPEGMHQFLHTSMAIWHVAHGQGTWVARGPIAAKQQGCRYPKPSFQNDMGRRLNACAACSNSKFFWDEIQKYPSARDDVELYILDTWGVLPLGDLLVS